MLTKITCTALAIGVATIVPAWGGVALPHVAAPQVAVPHVGAPMQLKQVNFSSPASVRQFVSHAQPTNTSSGRYLPWMVQNMYGERGNSPNIAGRAVLGCGC